MLRLTLILLLLSLATAASAHADPGGGRDDYPAALIDRPLVLPRRMIEWIAGIDHRTRRALGIEVLSAQTWTLGARLGASARWEVGAATSFRLHPEPGWDRELAMGAAFRAAGDARLGVAPSVVVPVSLHRGYDVVSTVELGLGVRARLGRRLFAVAGRRLVDLDVRPAVAGHLVLDGGLGIQATPTLAVLGEADLAELTLFGPIHRTRSPADATPVAVRALWAVPWARLDAALELRVGDVLHPGDDIVAALVLAVRQEI